MANRNERHIVPNPQGGWDVKKSGSGKTNSHHDTLADAEVSARETLAGDGGGEAVIHDTDGKVRHSDTVLPVAEPERSGEK